MLPLDHPDRIQIAFDDHRLVASAPRFRGGRVWRAATALTTPTCCAPAGRLARSAAWSRHPPPWVPSCAVSGGATSASWTG